MGNFITNNPKKSLGERLRDLVIHSDEMKFLVGFFYFSGIKELYEELKKLDSEGKLKKGHIKILVGLNIDRGMWGIYERGNPVKNYSKEKIKDELFSSIKNAFTSPDLDCEDIYEQVEFFTKLLQEGKIILRKTREPNHAKLYLFKLNEELRSITPHLFITGSSNLTRAGLESQNEFNVEIKDYGFKEAEEYFDRFWKNSVEITEDDVSKIISIIRSETFLRQITPYEAYAYLLKTYLDLHKGEIKEDLAELMKKKGYTPYNYQLEAVWQAVKNCRYHNGTILADVVGLGKTVIACLVAKSLRERGIVICPPHLVGDENKTFGWKKYLEDFELYDWEVRSLGKLDEALDYVKNKNFKIVIVDEAHRFRNERTERYHYLREICRGKTVILLTATPFNNRPSDIFSLLKLFNIPKKSTIVYDENLYARFKDYEEQFYKLSYILRYARSLDENKRKRALEYYRGIFEKNNNVNHRELDDDKLRKVREGIKRIANEMRSVIEPVTIRRNRLDLKYYGEKIDLSEVKDPVEIFFELTKEQSKFYDEVIRYFLPYDEGGKFTGAIYFPARYEKIETEENDDPEYFLRVFQKNLYDFMRRLLVKRFESSFGSFRKSVQRFIQIHENVIQFVEKTGKFILDRRAMEEILDEQDPDKIKEWLLEYEKSLKEEEIYSRYYKVYDVKNLDGFIEDVKSDKNLFEYIIKKFDELELDKNDRKAEKLVDVIYELLDKKRKVVIFTEYIDTAEYLKDILERKFGSILLPAIGNLSKSTIERIYKNFDAQYKEYEDKYFILLTTDKLSEGFNLNRAGAVINYDIPWNPVRVIQRVGRINRVGKKVYDEIYIFNFFPTEQGADIVKSREIAEQKMFMIHNVLGEDAKIFSPDETPQPSELYRRLTTYREDVEEESFFTRVRAEYERIKKQNPEIEEKIKNIPNRVKLAKQGDEDEVLLFIKKGKDMFIGYKKHSEKRPVITTFENIWQKIKAEKDTKALPLSSKFWENYRLLLDKSSYYLQPKITSQKLEYKAFNLLSSILEIDDEKINLHKKFISDLIEDIREYGTISEYTLSKIVEWEKSLKDIKKISDQIAQLKNQIGEDFLKKIKSPAEEEEIIIAIENQKTGG